jgi:tRNA(Ile)-lysidine synthase
VADGATPGPAETFRRVAEAFEALVRGRRVGVAVSGGSDSIALLAMLHQWGAGRGLTIHAATVDHGLRSEARGEAEDVARFCASRTIAHTILETGDLTGPGNLSANAREARYAVLTDWIRGCVKDSPSEATVLLGHTMDDQAETVLMRLARGSGAEGLSGMSPSREQGGVIWARPLLGLRRAALRDWLQAEDIKWAEDPTNDDTSYDRVKARRALEVLEPIGITVDGLAETAERLGRQREVLQAAASRLTEDIVKPGPSGTCSFQIRLDRPSEGHRDTYLRVFADLLQQIAGHPYRPRFRSLEAAWDWACGSTEQGSRTLAGCTVLARPQARHILLFREHAAQPAPVVATDAWDGWEITNAPEGSYIGALGEAGCIRLSQLAKDGADLRAEWADMPRALRYTVPALFSDQSGASGAILAVPGANYATNPAYSGLAFTRVRSCHLRR